MPRLALALAAALAAPPAALAESGTARLLVSATVVRSVQVSVSDGGAGPAALRVRTSGGGAWATDVEAAANVPGVGLSPCATDPSYLVVTVLADAPFPAGAGLPPRS